MPHHSITRLEGLSPVHCKTGHERPKGAVEVQLYEALDRVWVNAKPR